VTVESSIPTNAAAPQPGPAKPPAFTPTVEQMHMVLAVSRLLAVPMELDLMLQHIAEMCTDMLGCERASIFLYDPDTSQLWTKIALNSKEIRVPCTAGMVGHAFTTNALVLVTDPYRDPRFNPEPDRRSGFVTRNLLTCPMVGVDGKPLGVIQAVNKRIGHFDQQDPAMIQLLADQAGVAIQRHQLQLVAVETAALRHEMDLAMQLQQALIPAVKPDVVGIESVGWTLAASTTGGDCFDLWKTLDDRLGILVADASGHGLGPAMMVTQARTLVRALSEIETHPHRLLARVNDRLADDLGGGRFVTAFYGMLSSDGRLDWSSAGHGPVFIRPTPDAELIELEPPCPPLAVIAPWWEAEPESHQIEPGGSIILVSDGIFEASNDQGVMFGVPRMRDLIEEHRHAAPEVLLGALRDAATAWKGTPGPDDDQTIVIVRRVCPANAMADPG
jgi:sigma-B regulation protein RsbU (phosphoserine phosphatase)